MVTTLESRIHLRLLLVHGVLCISNQASAVREDQFLNGSRATSATRHRPRQSCSLYVLSLYPVTVYPVAVVSMQGQLCACDGVELDVRLAGGGHFFGL